MSLNKKRGGEALCSVPVITMFALNVVRLPALAEAVKVNVAETELPAGKA